MKNKRPLNECKKSLFPEKICICSWKANIAEKEKSKYQSRKTNNNNKLINKFSHF